MFVMWWEYEKCIPFCRSTETNWIDQYFPYYCYCSLFSLNSILFISFGKTTTTCDIFLENVSVPTITNKLRSFFLMINTANTNCIKVHNKRKPSIYCVEQIMTLLIVNFSSISCGIYCLYSVSLSHQFWLFRFTIKVNWISITKHCIWPFRRFSGK